MQANVLGLSLAVLAMSDHDDVQQMDRQEPTEGCLGALDGTYIPVRIFAASRLDIPDAWQMPQVFEAHMKPIFRANPKTLHIGNGGIDENEDPRNAAIRELEEETGVTSADIVAEAPFWLTYDFPPEVRQKLKLQWGSDWKGQAQKWFLLKFNGKDEEVNLLGNGTEKPEFGQWSWMSPQEIVNHAVDFKKPVYEQVMKAFSPYLE
ncbi:hypothetical protein SASPL_102453 [Salvia splendens]|uniref:Nudix hydrolase domain-containing protein n=1 Tax=Salvia splendens TaxID=180675 RepID=A0A8X9AE98_SALSN|nr:hypothetical protein SASPL_102453 [Salvia splendens]